MNPISETEIADLNRDYSEFVRLGNTQLKAAYLAASGRGFNDLKKSNRDNVLLMRDTDKKYVVVSYPLVSDEILRQEKKLRIVTFHTKIDGLK